MIIQVLDVAAAIDGGVKLQHLAIGTVQRDAVGILLVAMVGKGSSRLNRHRERLKRGHHLKKRRGLLLVAAHNVGTLVVDAPFEPGNGAHRLQQGSDDVGVGMTGGAGETQ